MDKLCRLMSSDLPLTIEPKRLARKGATIAGQYAITDMQRLGGLLHDQSGQVTFNLDFTHDDDNNVSYIMGNVHVVLNIVCQRCLGLMNFTVDNPVYLGVIGNQEQAQNLPDECEPLLAGDKPIELSTLIEDEIILALPIAAMHDEEKCEATKLTNMNIAGKESPFAILKTLTEKSRK